MDKRENEIERYLRRQVEARGGRCVKFNPENNRGWPDRIVLLPGGVLVWVELKRPRGGVIAPAQYVAHEDLRRLGQQVCVVRTQDEVDRLIEEIVVDSVKRQAE